MNVRDMMTRHVELASPDDSIGEIARKMAGIGTGCIPLGENDRLVGIVTDRDIAIRAVAAGKGPDAPARDVMTPEIRYCYEDESVEDVVRNMVHNKLHRLPVMNRDKRLVGVVTLGDIALRSASAAGSAMAGASQPGGPHDR